MQRASDCCEGGDVVKEARKPKHSEISDEPTNENALESERRGASDVTARDRGDAATDRPSLADNRPKNSRSLSTNRATATRFSDGSPAQQRPTSVTNNPQQTVQGKRPDTAIPDNAQQRRSPRVSTPHKAPQWGVSTAPNQAFQDARRGAFACTQRATSITACPFHPGAPLPVCQDVLSSSTHTATLSPTPTRLMVKQEPVGDRPQRNVGHVGRLPMT